MPLQGFLFSSISDFKKYFNNALLKQQFKLGIEPII